MGDAEKVKGSFGTEVPEGIDPEKLPKHVAIIMDGNGRWAKREGVSRIKGHTAGMEAMNGLMRS